jgi:uncharacterized spore protein YtfJ
MNETPAPVIEPIENMMKKLNVSAVFGEPVREGNTTVIPVAKVFYGFGYGSGYGRGGKPGAEESQEPQPDAGEGGGSGGGAGGQAKPMGFVRIDAEGVRYEPFVDPTRISIAGLLLSAWSVFWITMTVRAFTQKPCCGG